MRATLDAAQPMTREPRRALTAAILLAVAVVVLTVLVGVDVRSGPLQSIDDAVHRNAVTLQTAWLTDVCKGLSTWGAVGVQAAVWAVVVIALGVARRVRDVVYAVCTFVSAEAAAFVVKVLVDRPRPPGRLVHETDASFPSGHAVAAALLAVGLLLLFTSPGRVRHAWSVVAVLYVLVMMFARVELSVHWASDVVTGALLGTAAALFWAAVIDSYTRARAPSSRVTEATVS